MTQRPRAHPSPSGEPSRPPPYRLAAFLRGHSNDVRAVASSTSPSRLFTASRDGTARAWSRERGDGDKGGSWAEERVWRDGHEGYINAVSSVPADPSEPDQHGFLATAGTDSLIQLFSLAPDAPPTPTHTLLGHAHNVCALHCSTDGRTIASASWDGTARVWVRRERDGEGDEAWTCARVLVEHEAAVWDVMVLEGEQDAILTASADSRIRLFSGPDVRFVFKGHQGPVRALAKLLPGDPTSTLFASASNDGTIRVWDYRNGNALTVLGTHDSFIYSLATIPSSAGGGLASSGEDGIISVWNEEDGERDQEVLVPALSVWSLATLPNGDLACGCSDNMVWLFTRDPARAADEATQGEYDMRLAERRATRAPQQERPVVHEPAVLDEPGSSEGEVKLVKRDEIVVAHQWDGSKWGELGEVVQQAEAAGEDAAPAPPPPTKMQHEGKEYDYVFRIDVKDDEPPLELPYNLDDDPHATAAAFIARHALPDSYLEQIVDFIRASTA
ncbi:hypothetical protein JCM3775_002372 [Rhodotorula graminis]|uniref:PFU domain-containing protein n=1 Tax=Rhodotorula graminis (strain WP1) TaxID=578459 RepID=A0A194S6D4_RHOGW|nr:uncharacterized protein RHOBADRAFT_53053 [Rhodotorula graminis WP1]KPV76055.1 hypothetical protein RHOBADRAFT_53053 [Rhodotorula graminis WP1]